MSGREFLTKGENQQGRAPFKELISVMDRFFKYKLDHILFWVLTILFHAYTRVWIIGKAGFNQFLFEIVLRNSLLAIVIYVTLLVVIPRLSKRKIISSLFLLILCIVLYVRIKTIHDYYLSNYVMGNPPGNMVEQHMYNLSILLFYLGFATALYLSKQW